ncbi:hypothetical protein Y032_0992g3325 [Ancylostoma ceylanicum]|uniref:Uncharacterized protein n=1 Tax=Ancylostoma ceylanicum TaxID=53326 RepID=A0A016W8U8_9BILA|nr:hypothetical protein Y032_0992g3325 [Ancylostoma ceylanicum]
MGPRHGSLAVCCTDSAGPAGQRHGGKTVPTLVCVLLELTIYKLLTSSHEGNDSSAYACQKPQHRIVSHLDSSLERYKQTFKTRLHFNPINVITLFKPKSEP